MHATMYRARLALMPALLLALPLAARAQQPLPLKHAPRPTAATISESDLMTRLYIFADDSMMGRQFGREGNFKGTEYIARAHYRDRAAFVGIGFNVLLGALEIIFAADDVIAFLFAWELFTLVTAAVVATEHEKRANRRAAFPCTTPRSSRLAASAGCAGR